MNSMKRQKDRTLKDELSRVGMCLILLEKESWDDVQLEDEQEDSTAETSPINYESLPDTNLLKRYYMKHKKDKEDDI